MSKIPTAEEFLINKNMPGFAKHTVFTDYMIEFAKLHVKEALQKAYENADLEYYGDEVCYNKDSILNAYPLENIK